MTEPHEASVPKARVAAQRAGEAEGLSPAVLVPHSQVGPHHLDQNLVGGLKIGHETKIPRRPPDQPDSGLRAPPNNRNVPPMAIGIQDGLNIV